MILNISLENWMSFRDRVDFSMVASRERQHRERVTKLGKYKTNVLPIAAIYGGNASGKTNFFSALSFTQQLVVEGTRPDSLIPVKPFQLDAHRAKEPSRFVFELLAQETVYEFSFTVTRRAVLEEKLVEMKSANEKVLYHRVGRDITFDHSLREDKRLQFVFDGTRDNQLFLNNTVSQNVDYFRPVYNWFRNTLTLIAPDSRFSDFHFFLDEEHPLSSGMNEMLTRLDTGIVHLGGVDVPLENTQMPESLQTELKGKITEGEAVVLLQNRFGNRYMVTSKNGELSAKKLMAYHLRMDGTETAFDFNNESDGSQRLIDLLPAFLSLSSQNSEKVYVVDEIDSSLHTLLTRRLLTSYLEGCSPDSRSQLLMTTHDALLIDQHLMRRDEMWVTERDPDGASSLISFSEYVDIRYDKDIRKSYLQGRLGGIPRIPMCGTFTSSPSGKDVLEDD